MKLLFLALLSLPFKLFCTEFPVNKAHGFAGKIASCSEYLLDEKLYDTWWLRFRDRGFRGKGKTCFELFPLGLSIKDRLTWTASEKKGYNNVIPWFQCP